MFSVSSFLLLGSFLIGVWNHPKASSWLAILFSILARHKTA